jgi:FdrA protein
MHTNYENEASGFMTEKKTAIIDQPIIAINLGLGQFAESLEDQAAEVVHVSWTPPAGGDEEMLDLLDKLL